jgi:hypothetical protein
MNGHNYVPPCSEGDLRLLYEARRMSQAEIANHLRISLKRVQTAMRHFGIASRSTARRDQSGSSNPSWKGSAAGYQAKHLRVAAYRGKPMRCEQCGTDDPGRSYDWANLTGDYDNPFDYRRMCRSCHSKLDNKITNITGRVSH